MLFFKKVTTRTRKKGNQTGSAEQSRVITASFEIKAALLTCSSLFLGMFTAIFPQDCWGHTCYFVRGRTKSQGFSSCGVAAVRHLGITAHEVKTRGR